MIERVCFQAQNIIGNNQFGKLQLRNFDNNNIVNLVKANILGNVNLIQFEKTSCKMSNINKQSKGITYFLCSVSTRVVIF